MLSCTKLKEGFVTACIDKEYRSNTEYQPKFLSNNYHEGEKVLSAIENELLNCEEFIFSVAFITKNGLAPLLQTLKILEEKGVKGKILTTDYLTFSEPDALKKLNSFSNIEVKVNMSGEDEIGFHTKGYIFKNKDIYKSIIGSSNLTQTALTKNKEWNTKIVSTDNGEMIGKVLEEFKKIWKLSKPLEEIIDVYEKVYKSHKEMIANTQLVDIPQIKLKPNLMQLEFIQSMTQIRESGAKRALLISATGTGKTYASAFELREEMPRRALFIVHREQIAKQAKESFRRVFGDTKTFGLISGNETDIHKDYLFSTMQMMSKKRIMEQFSPTEFSTIIIDEVHRAGAESYQKIMSYFKPNMWLGMTASPDRTDGFDIYKLFDHQIAYEIRLQQALEENLLCPFHYYGITDLETTENVVAEEDQLQNFNKLTSDERVKHVIENIEYYGYSGERVKGLMFCSCKNEARVLSRKLNEKGYRTVALTGEDSQLKREEAIEKLVSSKDDYLDYILTVDIFNEGVDIPEINQVVMLRPTESPIIFIQQLGRGLRKAKDKEFVMILDFIGNYTNNFMIPIALYGDRTYNKDTIRRYVMEGSSIIPGCSTIHFDRIAKERIFASIDKATTTRKMLKEKYEALKNRLGRIPTIMDFYKYGDVDPMVIINYAKTYDRFVRMVDKSYTMIFTKSQDGMLEYISSLFLNGKRPHELLMLKMLLDNKEITKEAFTLELENYGLKFNEETYLSATRVMNKEFINTQAEKKKYSEVNFVEKTSDNYKFYKRTLAFYQALGNQEFLKELKYLIEYGLKNYEKNYKIKDASNLVLYQKYSRKDVCRLLNWEKDESSTMYGYRIKYNTCPVFVTYKKSEDISKSTQYEDQFESEKIFDWETRSNVKIDSSEAQSIINYEKNKLQLYLFVKKSDGEGTDFYYLGKVKPIQWEEATKENDKGKMLPIMHFKLQLEQSVRRDIYDYIIS